MKLLKIIAEKNKSRIFDLFSDASLTDAARIMCSNKVGFVLVYDTKDSGVKKNYVGVISDYDIISSLCKNKDISCIKVSDVMTKKIIVAHVNDSVDYAMNVMIKNGISHLPVLSDDGDFLAVISIKDIMAELYEDDEIKIRYYGDYISGAYKNDVF